MIDEKPAGPFGHAGFLSLSACASAVCPLYEARAARRGAAAATARGAALTTTFVVRAAVRALVVKQRSSALSTLPSIAAAVSRITSDTSEMMRNLARSSMRFSRNERLLDLARKVKLLSTSATS